MLFFSDIKIESDRIVFKSKFSFVFLSHKPYKPFHILISPKRCVKTLQELSEEEMKDFFEVVKKMSIVQCKMFNKEKILEDLENYKQVLIIQNGRIAGQSVSHLHMHINFVERLIEKDILDDEKREKLEKTEMKRQIEILKKYI